MRIDVTQAVKEAIDSGKASTQEEIRLALEKRGLEITQSTVSRILKKVGAIKSFDQQGRSVYRLDPLMVESAVESSLQNLLVSIDYNDYLVVIKTTPGSASLVARYLDHHKPGKILGTIAGDDTIFVAPPAGLTVKKVVQEINRSIGGH